VQFPFRFLVRLAISTRIEAAGLLRVPQIILGSNRVALVVHLEAFDRFTGGVEPFISITVPIPFGGDAGLAIALDTRRVRVALLLGYLLVFLFPPIATAF